MYTFRIIQWLDGKMIGREAILGMILFDDPSNRFSSTDEVNIVKMLYYNSKIFRVN